MRKAISNSLLPFYTDLREQIRSDHDGFGIIVDQRHLKAFSFYLEDGGEVSSFTLIPVLGGVPVSVSTSLIDRWADEGGGTYFTFTPADTGSDNCGQHFIHLVISGVDYYSAILNIKPLCNDEKAVISGHTRSGLTATPENPENYRFVFSYADTAGNILSSVTSFFDGGTWRNESGGVIDTVNGEGRVKRVITTSCGQSTSEYYVTQTTLTLLSLKTVPHQEGFDIWEFTFSDSGNFDGIPYVTGHEQNLYLSLAFSEPTVPETVDDWENGYGEKYLNYYNGQERVLATASNIPDSIIGPIKSAVNAKTVTAKRLLTGITYPVKNLQVNFNRQNEGYYSAASLEWVRNFYHADAVNIEESLTLL